MMLVTELPYEVAGRTYVGYLADGSVNGQAPGVLVAHEASGMAEHVRERTRMLAEAGYVAFAMDTFGEPVRDRTHAMELMAELNGDPAELRGRAAGALKHLRGLEQVDAGKTAAIGFCFGGTTVLELARSGSDVDCVIAFHGILATGAPALPGVVTSRVLACVGALDPLIPSEQRDAFVTEMTDAGVDWQMLLIGNAGHSFTNRAADGVGIPGFAYDILADGMSWRLMLDLLKTTFATK